MTATACGGDARPDGGPGTGSPADEEVERSVEDHGGPRGVHGRAPEASGGIPAIVELSPAEAPQERRPSSPARGRDAVVDQFGLAFSPRVLIAAAGAPVRFTNSEGAISHNVRLRSIDADSTVFDGDTGPSEGIEVLLPGPGGYDVLCDMHPGMTGFVFITDAPYAVAADADGTFDFGPLPPGDYSVRVWTVDDRWTDPRDVTVETGPAYLDLTSDETAVAALGSSAPVTRH